MQNNIEMQVRISARLRVLENLAKEKGDAELAAKIAEEIKWISFPGSLPDEPNCWISVEESLPPIDQEVIVLSDYINGKYVKDAHRISFGHRPDPDGWTGKSIITGVVKHYGAVTYDGWNIPGVTHWIPCPLVPGEIVKEDETRDS